MTGLTWLHLSDLYQKGKNFDQEVVINALIKDIEERSQIHKDLENVDFIIFSGDVAFEGEKQEYEAAEKHFFEPVLNATGLDKSHMFIVPGNHDLDRKSFKFLPNVLLKPLTLKGKEGTGRNGGARARNSSALKYRNWPVP